MPYLILVDSRRASTAAQEKFGVLSIKLCENGEIPQAQLIVPEVGF